MLVIVALAVPAALADMIMPFADTQRGTLVSVHGTVERITGELEFRLADASGDIRILSSRSESHRGGRDVIV